MKISEIISLERIKLDLISQTKHGIIFELVELLDEQGELVSKKDFLKDVLERESLMSTGIGYGIAIPHAKSSYVKKPALLFGRQLKGVDFQSMDHEKAFLFFMIAMPEEGANAHLKILADLSRKLMHEDFREKLLEAQTKEEVLDLLTLNT